MLVEHRDTKARGIMPDFIKSDVCLKDKNWFNTGGKAAYFAEPQTVQQFSESVQWAHDNRQPVFLLGQGANILISDEGFNGLVVRPGVSQATVQFVAEHALVTAGAGISMPDLILWCLEREIIGLEEFSGIPGTVGGSVFINLHYFEFLMSQFIYSAKVVHKQTGAILDVSPEWFNFGYNYSTLHAQEYYLIEATFKLKKATAIEIAYARGRHDEIIRHRRQRYPNKNTCGSFFRNFYEHEVTITSNNKKMIYVAYYLDKIGVKGMLCKGDAQVSHQHANMIVNRGSATSADIIAVARTMQEMVQASFGIMPQPECRLVGFPEYPLHR